MVVYLVEFSNPNRPDIPPRRKPGIAKSLPHNVIAYRYGSKFGDYSQLQIKLLAYRQINRPKVNDAYKECIALEQKVLDTLGKKDYGRRFPGYDGPIDNVEEYFDIQPIEGSGGFTEMLHISRTDRQADIDEFLEITQGVLYEEDEV